jgi:hypothetical protein
MYISRNYLSRWRGSNPRHEYYKYPTLPTELQRHLVGKEGIEPSRVLYHPLPRRDRYLTTDLFPDNLEPQERFELSFSTAITIKRLEGALGYWGIL